MAASGSKIAATSAFVQKGDVAQVFLPHHAAADDAVTDGLHVMSFLISGARRSARLRGRTR
jgi:hypothetical protein